MGFKPGDFFLEPIDLFAVLVPGALGCFLVKDLVGPYVFASVQPTNIERWIAFALGSYITGHVLLALGSVVNLPLSTTLLKEDSFFDPALYKATANTLVETKDVQPDINPYWWAYAVVRLYSPVGRADVARADVLVKFFRSIVLILLIALLRFALAANWLAVGLCSVLMVLSFWRSLTHMREVKRLTLLYFLVFSKQLSYEKRSDQTRASGTDG
jgi:hypothetical protein